MSLVSHRGGSASALLRRTLPRAVGLPPRSALGVTKRGADFYKDGTPNGVVRLRRMILTSIYHESDSHEDDA